MKKVTFLKTNVYILLACFLSFFGFSQTNKTIINQDIKFEQLLNEKQKVNPSITLNNRFKIQIYTGDSETSKKALQNFKKSFKSIDGTIVFQTPIYKVWIGNFKTRIEAEKMIQDLSKKYPNAFLVKPNK